MLIDKSGVNRAKKKGPKKAKKAAGAKKATAATEPKRERVNVVRSTYRKVREDVEREDASFAHEPFRRLTQAFLTKEVLSRPISYLIKEIKDEREDKMVKKVTLKFAKGGLALMNLSLVTFLENFLKDAGSVYPDRKELRAEDIEQVAQFALLQTYGPKLFKTILDTKGVEVDDDKLDQMVTENRIRILVHRGGGVRMSWTGPNGIVRSIRTIVHNVLRTLVQTILDFTVSDKVKTVTIQHIKSALEELGMVVAIPKYKKKKTATGKNTNAEADKD